MTRDPEFFGYGSLVNQATHTYAGHAAILTGWRRVWVATPLRDAAFLSVEPDAQVTLHGILAKVPSGDWAMLDRREAAYLRHDVTDLIETATDAAVYQVAPENQIANPQAPILQSYLDVVVQGYLQMFGPEGVTAFFETTAGWNRPIQNDRAAPLYPRHQVLSLTERQLVDDHVALYCITPD